MYITIRWPANGALDQRGQAVLEWECEFLLMLSALRTPIASALTKMADS